MSYRWLLFTKEKNRISKEEINGYITKAFLGEKRTDLLIFSGYLRALNDIEDKKKILSCQDIVSSPKESRCIPFFYYGYARALYDNGLIIFSELKDILPFTESEWNRVTS